MNWEQTAAIIPQNYYWGLSEKVLLILSLIVRPNCAWEIFNNLTVKSMSNGKKKLLSSLSYASTKFNL